MRRVRRYPEFCYVPRSRAEILAFVGELKNHLMLQTGNPLVRNGKLEKYLLMRRGELRSWNAAVYAIKTMALARRTN